MRPRVIGIALLALLLLASVLAWSPWRETSSSSNPVHVFDSSQLKSTVIVPTSYTRIPDGKSAIWCASFQIAWDRLKEHVTRGPIELTGAEALCARLNASSYDETRLGAESYYVNAGWVKDGIIQTIQRDMGQRFPHKTVGLLPQDAQLIAYAYLDVAIGFTRSFDDDTLKFRDSKNQTTSVRAFGIGNSQGGRVGPLRDQVEVLFLDDRDGVETYAIDPDRSSTPYQIVLAQVARRDSLSDAWATVQSSWSARKPTDYRSRPFGQSETFLVPVMNWDLRHHFAELEEKQFKNSGLRGMHISHALQAMRFKIDRTGARLASEAGVAAKSASRDFIFNRPYLLGIMPRGSMLPFFLMWIDNAELMVK